MFFLTALFAFLFPESEGLGRASYYQYLTHSGKTNKLTANINFLWGIKNKIYRIIKDWSSLAPKYWSMPLLEFSMNWSRNNLSLFWNLNFNIMLKNLYLVILYVLR